MPGGEVVAVAEDGPQGLRHGAGRRLAAGQILVDAEAFQPAMQPFGVRGVRVAIGDKGAVAISDGFSHGCLDPMLWTVHRSFAQLSARQVRLATNGSVTVASRQSGASRNPGQQTGRLRLWIPAFAGMTHINFSPLFVL
jgi:hypothetical protein